MGTMTSLKMVQDILSDLDSDEIASISDTLEALQVSQILETTYFEIISQRDWPHLGNVFQLTAAGSGTNPTRFQIAPTVQKIEWIKYDVKSLGATRKDFADIKYITPSQFIERTNNLDSTLTTVDTVTANGGIDLLIQNDKAPQFYTTFDDEFIIMDSYEVAIETFLGAAKTQAFGYTEPNYTSNSDAFVADLPAKAFPYYLSEAKSVAFNALKQVPNAKEEQRSRRQRYKMAADSDRAEQETVIYPDYGRKR